MFIWLLIPGRFGKALVGHRLYASMRLSGVNTEMNKFIYIRKSTRYMIEFDSGLGAKQYCIEYEINDMGLFASRNCYARAPSSYSTSNPLQHSPSAKLVQESSLMYWVGRSLFQTRMNNNQHGRGFAQAKPQSKTMSNFFCQNKWTTKKNA